MQPVGGRISPTPPGRFSTVWWNMPRLPSQPHETVLSMARTTPAEVDASSDAVLKVRVACHCNCDLRGTMIQIVSPDGTIGESALAEFDGTANETEEFVVKMPTTSGAYTWTAVFFTQEKEGARHGKSSVPVTFVVRPHVTSMAVWDVPSSVVLGASFTVKVGVKCSADCCLAGSRIEVCDATGAKRATTTLGETPWPQTSGLHWAEIALESPVAEGVSSWRVRFSVQESANSHEGASSSFLLRTVRPPEYTVTVKVTDKDKGIPIGEAQIFLNPYRACTDGYGVAPFRVAGGAYDLDVLMDDYDAFQTSVEVASDVTIKAELTRREKGLWE
jgi:hypothetical protein